MELGKLAQMAKDQIKLDELNKRIDGMVAEATSEYQRWEPIYADGLNYVYDDQLANKKVKQNWDRVQTNYIYPAMTQEQAILSQNNTRIICQPTEEDDTVGANLWALILQWIYAKGVNVPRLRHHAVMDGKVYGHWITKPYWEEKAEWDDEKGEWKGEVRVTLLRPEYVHIDPDCEDVDLSDAKYAYQLREMTVAEAIELWPKSKVEIEQAADEVAEEFSVSGTGRYVSAASSKIALDGASASGERGTAVQGTENEGRLAELLSRRDKTTHDENSEDELQRKKVTVLEIYFKDSATESVEIEEADDFDTLVADGKVELKDNIYVLSDTGEEATKDNIPKNLRRYDRPKYPNGRIILRVNKTILNPDEKKQVWGYRRWPFILGVNYQLPHTWHGLNGVEMAKSPQDWINVIWSHLANYVKCFSDPVVKVEEGALQNDPDNRNVADAIGSVAGTIIKCTTGRKGGVEREPPPSASASLLEICQKAEQETRNATGVQEVMMGQQMSGEHTLGEVMRAESTSRLRTSLQAIFLNDWTIRLMEYAHVLCQENMTEEQKVRIIGESGDIGEAVLAGDMIDARFDIDLEVSTTMPFDTERRKQDAMALFGVLGPAYLEQLLSAYEVKDSDKVMEDYRKQMEAQAAAEAKQDTGEQQ